eukprot:PhM_4_TR11687/c3_g1_i6/m.76283
MVQRGTPVVSTITDSDLQAMKEAELVREVPASEVKNVRLWCKFFTVVEAAKQRRRIILWPRQGNAEVDYDCDIDLMSTLDHISQPTMGDWAACFDLTASFYQWPLNREVHNFFGFRDRSGRAFVFQRGVMGFAPMAELMDVAVKILATTGLPPGVRVATHIDNVRFLHADRALVAKAAENFRCNCDRVSVTLNAEPGNEPHQQGTFCGVVYDYA